jgi:hypothetical protein
MGLASAVSLLSLTVLAGGGWVLAFFGFVGITALRGAEIILRGSVFRAAYEVLYTPVPSADKRAVKAIIDISGERLGDIIGSGVLGLLLALHLSGVSSILSLAIGFSALGLVLARSLETSYTRALENSLRKQTVRLAPEPVLDDFGANFIEVPDPPTSNTEEEPGPPLDPILRDLSDLRSDIEWRVRRALARIEDPHPLFVHQLIGLLADDRYAFFAMEHLRRIAPAYVGQLVDALLDPRAPYAVRKRIPIILAVSSSQRALDELLNALSDGEFLVRFRCGHAMSQILSKHPDLTLDYGRIWKLLNQELQVSRDVWQERRLLEPGPAADPESDKPMERPGDASLEYVFVLLGLVLPRDSVSMAFRALQTDDRHLRGTALEYLQTVLPANSWKSLGALIGVGAVRGHAAGAPKNGSA